MIVIPQQVLALFIMSLHVTTHYLLHAASGRADKPNNPKLLSVGSDMSLFGSLKVLSDQLQKCKCLLE